MVGVDGRGPIVGVFAVRQQRVSGRRKLSSNHRRDAI